MRLHVDCSFTRLQPADVGITRVVRGLARGLRESGPDNEVGFVAYHRDGFRRAPSADAARPTGAAADLYNFSSKPSIRGLVKALTPPALQLWGWRHFSRITYSKLSAALPPARFGAGDILVTGDAGWGYDVWACTQMAKRSGARVVTILYDLIPINHPEYCSEAHQLLFRRWLPGALETSDAMLCISEASRAELARYCDTNGIACPPSAAFRLGGDLPPAAAGAPAPSRIPAGAPYFLSVGSIEPRKDHALLLDAFERAWSGGLDARLAIVGRPVDGAQATVARIRAHAELGKRLFLFTDAGDAELDALYRGARAVVLASRAEGFGLPLVEARQRGCAVIATRLPAFEERADEGVRLFAPGDAQALAALLAAEPRPVSPMPPFTWRDSARQFIDAIQRTSASRTP